MPQITKEECERLVNAFVDSHIDNYTEREIKYIRRDATRLLTYTKVSHFSSLLRQIYDEVGIKTEGIDIYQPFLSLLEDNFNINRNIVEVGGGAVPSLAKQIALRQETGTITVYDPRLITPTVKPENLILKREIFKKETPIPTTQMLIGFMPCEAVIPIIESACSNNIDFMVALCEGGVRKGYGWIETDDEWIGFIEYMSKQKMKNTTMGNLEVNVIEEYSPYPVIYNKRKK